MIKFPDVINAWATKDGRYEFDTKSNLFPVGQSAEYMLSDTRNAAIWFKNPDEFCLLIDGLNASTSEDTEGRLCDALDHVIRVSQSRMEVKA